MLFALCCAVWQPVALLRGAQDMGVWLFVASWFLARAVIYTCIRKQELLHDLQAVRKIYLLLALPFKLHIVTFGLALTLVSPAIVLGIGQITPLLWALFTLLPFWRRRALKETEKQIQQKDNKTALLTMSGLATVGAFGAVLVILSNNELTFSGGGCRLAGVTSSGLECVSGSRGSCFRELDGLRSSI